MIVAALIVFLDRSGSGRPDNATTSAVIERADEYDLHGSVAGS
jgi:hypothetical protein